MAGLESLAMGIPVIAADNRGTREYMEHGKNGFVCRYDDVEGFVEGIERIRNPEPGEEKEDEDPLSKLGGTLCQGVRQRCHEANLSGRGPQSRTEST